MKYTTEQIVCMENKEAMGDIIEKLLSQRAELLEALKRFTAYGKVFAYKAGEQCPYEQAIEAITNTEATK